MVVLERLLHNCEIKFKFVDLLGVIGTCRSVCNHLWGAGCLKFNCFLNLILETTGNTKEPIRNMKILVNIFFTFKL